MKKLLIAAAVFIISLLSLSACVFAQPGKIGFFGGITEGTRLPKTTEQLIAQTTTKKNTSVTVPYKEVLFLTGQPIEYSGTMTVKTSAEPVNDLGTIKVTYTVAAKASEKDSIARNIVYNVNYRKQNGQTVYDYEAVTRTETITAGGTVYKLVPAQSHFSVSILEDKTPGVSYFRGDISQKSVYSAASGGDVTFESSGSIYGYDCAWSNTETQRLDCVVYGDGWQTKYQVRPSVSVNKTLQYTQNEPTAISFPGNFKEVMSNQSGLQYDIFVLPQRFSGTPFQGSASISTFNAFEQLTAPDVSILKGHAAEDDIKKLYALGILSGPAEYYVPNQAVTRGEFVTMLVKAIKLPVEPVQTGNSKKNVINVTFPDVLPSRADYPYIMAANKSGLAVGRGNGRFYVDYSLEKEEAYAVAIRALGLSNLGLNPGVLTVYADNAKISDWAKREINAGTKIGLFKPDASGNINPKSYLSKAEAAALINSITEYMRTGLQLDYTEHIVNYTY